MKKILSTVPGSLTLSLGLFCCLLSSPAPAIVYYWDPNGLSTPASGIWDTTTPQWSTTSALTATPVVWDPTVAAGFPAGTANISALTISVNSPIGFAGMFNGVSGFGATNLIINGSGSLSLNAGLQGFSTAQSYYNTIIKVPITGPGGLQNQAGGSLYLSGANTYSGGTSIGTSAGLNFNNSSVFGTGTVTNSVSTSVLATPANDSSGTAFATAPITIANAWQTFGGNNTEILVGLAAAPVTFSGPWTLTGAAGTTTTLDVRTTTWSISGPISGAANLTKINTATLVLSGANTYTGKTSINNGSASVNSLNKVAGGSASGSLGAPTTIANGTINLGTTTTAGTLIYTGSGETTDRIINLGGTTGGGVIQNDGSGAITFTSDLTATGAGAKTLTLQGSSTAANTISGAIVDNSTANPTALTKSAAGSWTLAGANTYSGKTVVGAGTLKVSSVNKVTGASASSSLGHPTTAATGTIGLGATSSSGTLVYTGAGETTDRAVDLAGTTGGGTIQNDGAGPLVFTTDFTASGSGAKTLTLRGANTGNNIINGKIVNGASATSVAKSDAGTWTLAGANTYSGNTTLNTAGQLNLANPSALGTGTLVIGGNGFFDNTSGADLTIANGITCSSGSPTYVGGANNMTINGAALITGANRTITVTAKTLTLGSTLGDSGQNRNFQKAGAGTLVLRGAASYGGSTIVNSGALMIGGSGQLGGGAYAATIIITNGGTFNYASSAAQTLSGVISGTGTLIQNGPGALTLSGANTYTGPTFVVAGTLDISAAGSIAAGTVTIAAGTLELDSNIAFGSAVNLFVNAGSPAVNLNYTGTDQISLLSFDGGATFAAKGTYGGIGSGANFEDPRFSGTGLLAVLYAASASVAPSANPIAYGDSVTLTATVTGPGPTPTGTVTFKDGATILGSQPLDGTGSAALPVSGLVVASHPVTVLYSGDSNYAPAASPTVALAVNQAALTITANNQTKTYGQTVAFASGSTAFSSTGLQYGETIGSVTLACSGGDPTAPVSGSPYTITPSAATGGTFNANNYTITYNTGTLTVNPAILTVTATGLLVYGSDPSNAVYFAQYATLQGTDTLAVITGSADFSTDATSSDHVGSNYVAHVVDIGTLSSPNYAFAPGADGVLTITNRPLTATNIVADNKVYDGTTAATLDFSGAGLSNLVNGDVVSLVTSSATGAFVDKNVGIAKTVPVTGLSISGDLGTNYFLVQPNTTIADIAQLAVTVTAVTDAKVYDGTTTSTGAPVPTSALASGDTGNFSQTFDNRNAGNGKVLTPSGSVTDGNGGANYALTFATVNSGTINQMNITVTAVTDTKGYDGTTASTGIPNFSPALISGDTPAFSQIFDNKNAGTGKTLIPIGSVNDGNTGLNYAVSFVNDTTGVITQMVITVTAVSDTKVYDGTTNSSASPSISPALVSGDTSEFSEAYDTKNVGTGKTLVPFGQARDGNGGLNYSVTFASDTTGAITQMPITVTAVATTKVYDGTTSSPANPAIAPSLAVGDVSAFIQTYDTKDVGINKTLTPAGTVLDGNGGANYNVTFANNANGVITELATTNILLSSMNPSALGSNVTFTFTINGNPPAPDLPTGSVVFFDATGPFATNNLVNGSCSASASFLPVGTNLITASYFGDNNGPDNFGHSSGTLNQVVTNSITYSTTNIILSIANNNDGTVTLNALGTPGAQYYLISSPDVTLPLSSWTILGGSTNTASTPDGLWSQLFTITNASTFFRSAAINPAP